MAKTAPKPRKRAAAKKPQAEAPVVTAFKAFKSDLTCNGFQYKVGETFKHEGVVEVCRSGFHACTNPMDVWRYYDLIDTRYAIVEMRGVIAKNDDEDTKIASAEITIKAELKLPDFIKSAVKFVINLCKDAKDESVQAASGHSAKLAASGDSAQLAASGDSAKLAASGDSAQLAASGHSAKLAASGHSAKLAASGDSAKLAASGHSAKLAASGHSAQLAASGDSAQLAASGDSAKLAASGDYAKLAASGEDSVIASSSYHATAKGASGTWISLAEFNSDGKCVGFATGKIGDDGLEPDTYYRAQGGKLVTA